VRDKFNPLKTEPMTDVSRLSWKWKKRSTVCHMARPCRRLGVGVSVSIASVSERDLTPGRQRDPIHEGRS
jgi:hypothetical protein